MGECCLVLLLWSQFLIIRNDRIGIPVISTDAILKNHNNEWDNKALIASDVEGTPSPVYYQPFLANFSPET